MITNLITGANGQLGSEIRKMAGSYPGMSFHFTDIEELDICDSQAVIDYLDKTPVKYIVNCAAYTAVDSAENEAEKAMQINEGAVDILAGESVKRDIQLIHISTDYVFNGENNRPYRENDPVNPQTIYGKSKLAGEQAVGKSGKGIIIRTSWLYSGYGNNFVKTILRVGREKEQLQVVFDQTGSPTNAGDLATAILEMVKSDHNAQIKPRFDIYHFSNRGICSWYEFATEIIELAGIDCGVKPVESKDYPTNAPRPRYSVLDTKKLIRDYKLEIPYWRSSLEKCIIELTRN